LKEGLTPRKDVEFIRARTDTLSNGLDYPLRECNKRVIHRFKFVSVGNPQDDIGGAMSEMCLGFCRAMQQWPEQGVRRPGLLVKECVSGGAISRFPSTASRRTTSLSPSYRTTGSVTIHEQEWTWNYSPASCNIGMKGRSEQIANRWFAAWIELRIMIC